MATEVKEAVAEVETVVKKPQPDEEPKVEQVANGHGHDEVEKITNGHTDEEKKQEAAVSDEPVSPSAVDQNEANEHQEKSTAAVVVESTQEAAVETPTHQCKCEPVCNCNPCKCGEGGDAQHVIEKVEELVKEDVEKVPPVVEVTEEPISRCGAAAATTEVNGDKEVIGAAATVTEVEVRE